MLLSDNFILTKDSDGTIHGVAWNPVEDMKVKSNLELNLELPVEGGEYALITKLVDRGFQPERVHGAL